MTTNSGKSSPSKFALKLTSFKAEPLSIAESSVLDKYMRSLPRSAIDSHANDHSLNLMMVSCLNHLISKNHTFFKDLDITKPQDGGVKFASFKTKVSELMEELGAVQENLGSGFKTDIKHPPEEEKLPESSARSLRSTSLKNPPIPPKKLNFENTPKARNLQTENDTASQKQALKTPKNITLVQPPENSGATSQLSDIEAYFSEKFRENPQILEQFRQAREDKKRADQAQAEAREVYEQTKRAMIDMILADSDDEVADFVQKRQRFDDSLH